MLRTLLCLLILALELPCLAGRCSSHDHFFCTGDEPDEKTNNIFGPNLKISMTPFRLTDCSIVSATAEIGGDNNRFSGTFGWFISPHHRCKVTVEQLNQRLGYHFYSGRTERWLHQLGIGGTYKCLFRKRWVESLELNFSYSHCKSRKLHTKPCCVKSVNLLDRVERHLAGAWDGFCSLGLTTTPWKGGFLSLLADYDYVSYHRKIFEEQHLSGVGGTAKLRQLLPWGLALELKGELRRPFRYYEGSLNWTNSHTYGLLTMSVYAGYTSGRNGLPNNWTSGLLISADFGGLPFYSCYANYPPPLCAKGCKINSAFPVDGELIAWVAHPAIRMPAVLAVGEQRVISTTDPCPPPPPPHPPHPPHCKAPESTVIPTQFSLPFDASAFFDRQGLPMTFSETGLPFGFFINSDTGVIHGNIERIGTIIVTVTGTTSCGSTSETFAIVNPYNPYDPYYPYGPY